MTTYTSFDLLGYKLKVEHAPPSLLAWLKNYWGFSHSNKVDPETPVSLRWSAKAFANYPSQRPFELYTPEGVVHCINQEPIIWLGNIQCGAQLDLQRMSLEVWGTSPSLYAILHIALTEVVRVKGLLPLHAAVVVRGGTATAFLGASGSGKTTTLLAAVEQGWQALCEDFVWLEPETFNLYRWDRGLRLLPDTEARFHHLLKDAPVIQVAGKRFVRYHDLGWPPPEAVLTHLRWLKRQNSASTTLSKVEATGLLWEATGVPISTVARQVTIRAIPNLLAQLKPQYSPGIPNFGNPPTDRNLVTGFL